MRVRITEVSQNSAHFRTRDQLIGQIVETIREPRAYDIVDPGFSILTTRAPLPDNCRDSLYTVICHYEVVEADTLQHLSRHHPRRQS